MLTHQEQFSIAAMSRVLRVTRQGYHAWLPRDLSARALANALQPVTTAQCIELPAACA